MWNLLNKLWGEFQFECVRSLPNICAQWKVFLADMEPCTFQISALLDTFAGKMYSAGTIVGS